MHFHRSGELDRPINTILINAAKLLGVAVAYVIGAKVGFFLAFFNSQVSPVWPPEGIALAAVLLWKRPAALGVLVGAIAANYMKNPHLPTALLIGLGNTGGVLLNTFLVLRWAGSARMLSGTPVLIRFFASTIPGSALSAFVGVTSLWFFSFAHSADYMDTWLTWFSGETQGFLIVAPFLLTWVNFLSEKWDVRKLIEGTILTGLLAAASYFSFSKNIPASYIPIPFVVLCALRFGEYGATLAIIVLSMIAVFHTVGGRGPFAIYSETGDLSRNDTLILLDIFVLIVTATAYVLVTMAKERHAAMEESLNSLITLEKVKDHANKELETKVIERTRIIAQQKQELEDQIALAEKIQMSLLPPKIANIENCSLDFRYQPMMKIGGDFIDVRYNAGAHSLGLFICDVTGHGVPAAFLAVMVKMALSRWDEKPKDVRGAIQHIHASLRDKLGENFVTACVVHVDLRNGELRVASAGHHPVIVVHEDGKHQSVKPRGRMIMAHQPTNSEEAIVRLKKGDRMIMYTDGLTEARGASGALILDEPQLIDAVARSREPVPDLCGRLFDDVVRGSGGADFLEDDISLLLLEFSGG